MIIHFGLFFFPFGKRENRAIFSRLFQRGLMHFENSIYNFVLTQKLKMKGVIKWVGSIKKQKHSVRSSVDKAAYFYLAKLLKPSNILNGERKPAQSGNTKKQSDGQDLTDLHKKEARPDSSGQGSQTISSTRADRYGYDEIEKSSCLVLLPKL